jgi:TfoX/Sxy family transcriptional regulator of competence genes
MTYDAALAARVRERLQDRPGYSERQMFGGICFLLGGHMCCGVVKGDLMVRVGPEQYDTALARPHARLMDFTGRPLRGMVYVGHAGLASGAALRAWVERGAAFAASLPAKKKAPRGRTRRPPARARARH